MTYSWEWNGSTGYIQGLRLMLASGDVPDAIRPPWSWEMNKELIDSGLAIPLDDLLEEYGPNILKGGLVRVNGI